MKTFAIIIAMILSQYAIGQTNLTVTVTNIPNEKGKILFGLFTEKTFLKAVPDFRASSKVENNSTIVVFENIPAGEYAITCFQDKNANQHFDFGPRGIPQEPYGTSNNPPSVYGPPKWSDAKFTVADQPISMEIRF